MCDNCKTDTAIRRLKPQSKWSIIRVNADETRISNITKEKREEYSEYAKGTVNKFIHNKQIPRNMDGSILWIYDRNNKKFIYIPIDKIAAWEHSNVHKFKTPKELMDWYYNIPPLSVNQLGHGHRGGDYNFSDGNHRVNTCKTYGLPIPAILH